MANWKLFMFIIDEEDVKMAKMVKMPEWQSVSLSGNESQTRAGSRALTPLHGLASAHHVIVIKCSTTLYISLYICTFHKLCTELYLCMHKKFTRKYYTDNVQFLW